MSKYKNLTRILRNGRNLLGGSSYIMKIRASFYDGERAGPQPSLVFLWCPTFRLPPSCLGTSKRGRVISSNLLLSGMRWPKTSTLIMEAFTKSNFPPGRGDLPIPHPVWQVLPLFHQEISSTQLLFFILKMHCGKMHRGYHITLCNALGAGSS